MTPERLAEINQILITCNLTSKVDPLIFKLQDVAVDLFSEVERLLEAAQCYHDAIGCDIGEGCEFCD